MKLKAAGMVLASMLLASSSPLAQQGVGSDAARLERFKATVVEGVEARRKLAQVINDTVFSFGELGYQEFETSKYLTDVLEKNGFTVERGVAGMPTAWVARWGSGKPVIALGSDIDCIPKASQKPGVAYREQLVEGAPGHGEGHNSGQAVNIVAALAVKDLMEREKLPGTIVIWPGVAEELLGGKAYLVRAGVFKDVDAVLFTHVGNNFCTAWGQPNGTGLVSVEYTFDGESAHAAAGALARTQRAARGRADEHRLGFPARAACAREQRSHYVITNGGDQPNVVPSLASVWYFFREMDFENIKRNYEIGNTIAEAAAMMTDTTVTRKADRRRGAAPLQQADRRGVPGQHRAGRPAAVDRRRIRPSPRPCRSWPAATRTGLPTEREAVAPPVANPESGGSDDIGDVSWVVPTATAALPGQHSEPARPQLVERHRDGDADRAQGHRGRLQGDGDDDGRSAAAPGSDRRRQRPISPTSSSRTTAAAAAACRHRRAAGPDQPRDHGALPAGDAQVLLRRVEVRHVSRSAGREVSATGEALIAAGRRSACCG